MVEKGDKDRVYSLLEFRRNPPPWRVESSCPGRKSLGTTRKREQRSTVLTVLVLFLPLKLRSYVSLDTLLSTQPARVSLLGFSSGPLKGK